MKTKLKPYYLLKDDDELVLTGKQLREWKAMIVEEFSKKLKEQIIIDHVETDFDYIVGLVDEIKQEMLK